MKHLIRDYLSFSKRERNGVVVLLAIITVLLIWLNISDKFEELPPPGFAKLAMELDSLNALAANDPGEDLQERKVVLPERKSVAEKIVRPFNFDPNNLPEADWKSLGFTEKQIRMIKNYESKGGKFRKKEDLKKMYCIKNEQYEMLEPFIQIQSPGAVFKDGKVASPAVANVLSVKSEAAMIELNTADSTMLTTIKGIGPFYAKSIVKYRNELGGFYSKEQLMEMWKFDKEKFDKVEMHITVDASLIKKININTCEAEQLKGPYLKWNAANAIVNYRKQHGKFKSIEDIKLTDLVNDETLRKIAPYLIID